ncbi:MAG: hypothetical protein LUQ49_00845 [Methanomicrobiales archaeon]|nr:hypothetical protein [Methanomicrobiales archaeon]
MPRKILTIGITINLENYENLRLEVQGEIGPEGTTEELISFLDGVLTRLGHGDQPTAELVEAYRRRVLAYPGSAAAAAAPVQRASMAEAAAPAPSAVQPEPVSGTREPAPAEARPEAQPPKDERPVTVRVIPEGKAAKPAPKAQARAIGGAAAPGAAPAAAPAVRVPEPRKAPAPQAPKETAKEPAKPEKPPTAEGEVPCEACGASITRNQEKLSRLLTGKSLCKRCMNP